MIDLQTLLTRFIAKVEFTDTCWLWTGGKDRWGYGQFNIAPRTRRAHRWLYEICTGAVPSGLELDHLCRNTTCVNPDHLEVVSHRTNVLRGYAARPRKTHCLNGHEFAGDNLRIWMSKRGSTQRQCCACLHDRYLQRKAG